MRGFFFIERLAPAPVLPDSLPLETVGKSIPITDPQVLQHPTTSNYTKYMGALSHFFVVYVTAISEATSIISCRPYCTMKKEGAGRTNEAVAPCAYEEW